MEKDRLEFVSYDGDYPNLCSGTLVMRLDGNIKVFPEYCLSSGGYVGFDDDYNDFVCHGKWTITEFPDNFPEELKKLAVELVNKNVPPGCCGGCI